MSSSNAPEVPASRSRRWLKEAGAGLTVAAGSIPNELSYGLLAFSVLGPAAGGQGVFAAMLAGMLGSAVATLAGSRTGQIHGARPALALIVADLVVQVTGPGSLLPGVSAGSAAFISLMFALAFAALLQLAAAMAGWGRFVRYVPYPVQAGFFNGVAVLMMIGGIRLIFHQDGHWGAAAGVLPVTLLVLLPGFVLSRRWPGLPLLPVLVLLSAVLHHVLVLNGIDAGHTVGDLAIADFSFSALAKLPSVLGDMGNAAWLHAVAGAGLAIALVSSLETLFAASRLDALTHERRDTRRELVAVGLANLVLAPTGGLPAAAAVSRANAAFAAGGRTRAPAFIYIGILALLWLFGLDMLATLPRATIGAGLVLLSLGVLDRWSLQSLIECCLGRTNSDRRMLSNLAVSALVTLIAVAVGLLEAVAAGLVGAMFLFARDHSRSVVRQVLEGSVTASLQIRPAWQQMKLAAQAHQYALIELEGMLFFGTAEDVEEIIERRLAHARFVVLDCARLADIDLSGAQVLTRTVRRLRARQARLLIAGLDPQGPRAAFLARSGLERALPAKYWFANADAALEWVENQVLESQSATRRLEDSNALHTLDLCAGMRPEQARHLGSLAERRVFARGEVLFRSGEASDALYVLLAGSVSILRADASAGTAVRVTCLSAGLTVGEMGLIENEPRTADAVADTTVEALRFDRAALERLHRETPDIAAKMYENIARSLGQRLRDTTHRLHAYMRPT